MRTPLTVATGLLLVAGVVVGVTAAQASTDDVTTVQPIRVGVPAVPVPAVPAPAADPVPVRPPAAPRDVPRDPDGYVAPPPAADDDDDDDDGFDDGFDDGADDDGDD
jgi:hypothetical protein